MALSELDGGPLPPGGERTVGAALRHLAATAPGRTVLTGIEPGTGTRSWTAAQLLHDAERVAGALLRHHTPGDRVATSMTNRAEAVLLQFGVALAGMVLAPVNPRSRPAELEHALRLSGARLLVTDRELDVPPPTGPRVVVTDGVTQLFGPVPASLPTVDEGDLAQIQFTSGTSGRPKGVRIRHVGMIATGHAFAERIGLRPGDVWLNPMPLFHTAGNVLGVMASLSQQAEHVVLPFDPGATLRAVQEHRATYLSAAPTLLALLMEHPEFDTSDLSSLRAVFTGGSTVLPTVVDTIEERFGAPLAITFGMTETCGSAALVDPLHDPVDVRRSGSGRLLRGTEARVVGADGAGVPLGAEGELQLRGVRVTDGYHDDPTATAAAIDHEGWLHTGDLAVVDDRGGIRIVGRLKDMIKSGGENVSPDEVEDVLVEHPSVSRAAVVGVPDARWGELVVAFVVPREGATVDEALLDEHCRERLSTHKRPRRWHVVTELPLSASMKVQRAELRLVATAGRDPVPAGGT